MYFIVFAKDVAGGLPIRRANRDAHLAWLKADPEVTVHVAGPLLSDDAQMMGSTLIVEAMSKSAITQWLLSDPYAKAGLTASVEVHGYNWAVGAP